MFRKRSLLDQPLVLAAAALTWSVGLILAALVAPVYGSNYGSRTLIDENGQGVLLIVALPAVVCVVVGIALWHKNARRGRFSGYVAWVGALAVGALSLAGILTIGVFIAPVAILLARAAAIRVPSTTANGA